MKKMTNQQGFTIVELMIALFLGLIILTAVVQVFIMSTRTAVVQQSGSQILDANVFGLQQVETNLRLAGLDLAQKSTGKQKESGIIVSADNVRTSDDKPLPNFNVGDQWITKSNVGPNFTSRSGSDQLVIQYRAPMDMRDCEGNLALGEKRAFVAELEGTNWVTLDKDEPVVGQLVVERYFLKPNAQNPNVLELRCDAGRYETIKVEKYTNTLTGDQKEAGDQRRRSFDVFVSKVKSTDSNDGVVVASNIDDFKVLFAIAEGNNTRYVTPKEYVASHNNKPIVAVKMALIAKGDLPTMSSDISTTSFDMLGETVTLKNTNQNHIRRVYESNSMLRNSRERN